MILELIQVYRKYFLYVTKNIWTHYLHRRAAAKHNKTYKLLPDSKVVLVIGGSFSGAYLALRLAESLPPGYRVILVERNSHFNYTFNFPRYTVYEGKEYQAFIPFDGYYKNMPEGIFERVIGEVGVVRENEIELLNGGRKIHFDILAVATGALLPPPARMLSSGKADACEELRTLQRKVREASSIAIVGGGAVGVQIAGDIKTFLPAKRVVLIHSRQNLLPSFGVKLSDFVIEKLKALRVVLVLGERPVLPKETTWESRTVEFKDGTSEKFDLLIPCTGQNPNSSLIAAFSPSSISPQTKRILVKPTLQLKDDLKESDHLAHIFALGDVAETGGPKMARAGMMQAELVRGNILAHIQGTPMKKYAPKWAMEGILKLSLGKAENVTFVPDDDTGGYLFPGKAKSDDLEVAQMWTTMGADMNKAAELE